MKKEGSHAKLTKLKDMRIDYEKKGQFSQKVFFPLMVKPAEKSFCTIRRPCIPHKQWFDIIQELKSSQVYYKLTQLCGGTFPRQFWISFFWLILFWLVLFLVVCFFHIFFSRLFFVSFFRVFFSGLFSSTIFQGLAIHSRSIPRDADDSCRASKK